MLRLRRLPRRLASAAPARKRVDLADRLADQLHLAGIRGWVREHRFHATRRWRFDIAFEQTRLAVECDGFAAGGKAGRHQRPAGVMADNEKLAEAAIAGWRVMRCTGRQISSGEALRWIERALMAVGER